VARSSRQQFAARGRKHPHYNIFHLGPVQESDDLFIGTDCSSAFLASAELPAHVRHVVSDISQRGESCLTAEFDIPMNRGEGGERNAQTSRDKMDLVSVASESFTSERATRNVLGRRFLDTFWNCCAQFNPTVGNMPLRSARPRFTAPISLMKYGFLMTKGLQQKCDI
jgi:hypothetical protein